MAEGGSTVPVGDKQSRDNSENNLSDPIVVLVAGKIGSGKSSALNSLFDLSFEARSSPTCVTEEVIKKPVQRNGRFFSVIDTPGLGGRRNKTETVVKKMFGAVKEDPNFVLVYCLPVKLSDTLTETDRAIVKTMQSFFGRHLWDKCVLLLTFSDIARREVEAENETNGYMSYISYLQGHIEAFHHILTACEVKHSEIKMVLADDGTQLENYSSKKVVAIPVTNTKDSIGVTTSPGINTSWTELALDEIIKASRIQRPSEDKHGCYGAVKNVLGFAWEAVKHPQSSIKKVSEKVLQKLSEEHDSDTKSS